MRHPFVARPRSAPFALSFSVTAFVTAFVAASLAASVLRAQAPRWREIGTTSTGNPVFLDPRSVSRDSSGIITATLRSTYVQPVATPQGPITATRATAMFDCVGRKVAVKESIIYHDEAKGTIYRRSAPVQPGFGPVFTSNFSGVALDHLCKDQGATPTKAAPKAPPKAPPQVP